MSRIVIYHADCVDGFTAAWAAWFKYGYSGTEYIPARYGEAPPAVGGKEVLIVDFSYPRLVLLEMEREATSIRVLDHHKTAAENLAGLEFAEFDMSRSGAGMAWDALHHPPRPPLIDYVQDRDLWLWELPESKAVSAYIALHDRTFETWCVMNSSLLQQFCSCVEMGKTALRVTEQYVEQQAPKASTVKLAGYCVPCINTTFATSELVGGLAEHAPFAVGWFQRQDGKFVYSLRSRGDFDVTTIAKQFGGGGHKNAAGFTVCALVHEACDICASGGVV